MASVAPPRSLRQNSSETIATGEADGRSSRSAKSRPSDGCTPIAWKKLAVTRRPTSRLPSPAPVHVKELARETASASNDRVRAFQSREFGHEMEIGPPAPLVSLIHMGPQGSANGSGASRVPVTTEKIAVDAPIP